jgi:hypothetical protein
MMLATLSVSDWITIIVALGGMSLIKLVGSIFIKTPADGVATVYILKRVQPQMAEFSRKLEENTEISSKALAEAQYVRKQLPNGDSPGLTGYLQQQKERGETILKMIATSGETMAALEQRMILVGRLYTEMQKRVDAMDGRLDAAAESSVQTLLMVARSNVHTMNNRLDHKQFIADNQHIIDSLRAKGYTVDMEGHLVKNEEVIEAARKSREQESQQRKDQSL